MVSHGIYSCLWNKAHSKHEPIAREPPQFLLPRENVEMIEIGDVFAQRKKIRTGRAKEMSGLAWGKAVHMRRCALLTYLSEFLGW